MALFALATEAAAIAQKGTQLANEVNTVVSRGVVVHIENRTSVSLELIAKEHDSGDFNDPPDNTIPPNHASLFGSKGSIFGLGPAAVGRVQYAGQNLDLAYHVDWDVPIIGDNSGSSRCDGGARQYFRASSSVGGFASSIAKHDLSFKSIEDKWRRCARCGTLNRQTGGLDSACVNGTTHDNSVSHNYFLISDGSLGVDPFVAKHCTKCECLISLPVPGSCAAGGVHDVSEPGFYTIVAEANAPGETGWRVCATCTGLVIDASRPCPTGGVHTTVPAPVFTFWDN